MIKFQTFSVTQALSAAEVEDLKAASRDKAWLFPLVPGYLGRLPRIPANFIDGEMTALKPFVYVTLLHYTSRGLVEVSGTPGGNGHCMVPLANISVGVEVTDEPAVVSDLVLANPTLRVRGGHGQSPFRTFLESFLGSLSTPENISAMKELGVAERVTDFISNDNRRTTLVREFLNGMTHCGTLELFQNGLPTLEQIWDSCKRVRLDKSNPPEFERSNGSFFYVMIYRSPEDPTQSDSPNAVYYGHTGRPYLRFDQHRRALEGISGVTITVHHRIGAKILSRNGEYRMFPVSFIPKTVKDYSVAWVWAETALIALFQSFNPYLRRFDPNHQQDGPLPDAPDEAKAVQPERETYNRTSSAPLANRLIEIARKVTESGPILQDFAPRNTYMGCNWAVPLLENVTLDSNMWTRTTLRGDGGEPRIWQFRTHPRRIGTSKRLHIFFSDGKTTTPSHFRPTIPTEYSELGPGKIVNVVIEIMADEEAKHPCPFVQIPTVGPFDCWNQASRLGIRVEVLDNDGIWKSRYLSSGQAFSPFTSRARSLKPEQYGDELRHIELGWLHCMKIMGTLLRWRWMPQQNPLVQRVWAPYRGRVRCHEYDYLNQRIVISDLEAMNRPIPRLFTLEQTADLIEQRFGYDVHIGHFPGRELFWRPGVPPHLCRTLCDLCKMGADKANGFRVGIAQKCVAQRVVVATKEGKDLIQCPFSEAMRRYCTFTESIETRQDLLDLTYHHRSPFPVQNIPAPLNVLQYLEQRENEMNEALDDANDADADGEGL